MPSGQPRSSRLLLETVGKAKAHPDRDSAQLALVALPPAQAPEGGDDKYVERDECAGRVAGQGKEEFGRRLRLAVGGRERDRGKCRWLARRHRHAAKVDRRAERVFEQGLRYERVHAADIERRRSGGRDEVNKAKGLVGR